MKSKKRRLIAVLKYGGGSTCAQYAKVIFIADNSFQLGSGQCARPALLQSTAKDMCKHETFFAIDHSAKFLY